MSLPLWGSVKDRSSAALDLAVVVTAETYMVRENTGVPGNSQQESTLVPSGRGVLRRTVL